MQETQSWRRSLSRVVLGLLLAGAVYTLTEYLGFGQTQQPREFLFTLPSEAISQVEVTYFFQQEPIRQITLPTKGASIIRDSVTLLPGRYELQILLRGAEGPVVKQRSLQVADEAQLSIELRE